MNNIAGITVASIQRGIKHHLMPTQYIEDCLLDMTLISPDEAARMHAWLKRETDDHIVRGYN